MNPSSVPSWNERRFLALSSISPDNRTLVITTPADFTKFIVGLASLLGEVDIWSYEQGALSATQIADEYNNRTSYMYDFCALVADCIENNQQVRDALSAYLTERSVPTATPESVPAGDGSLIQGTCDDDKLYGAIVDIIEFLNLVSLDFLEQVASDSAWGSALLRAIDAIPILGDLPAIDDLSDFVEWITDNGLSTYESGYTVGLAQDIACNIFCASSVGCDLTPAKILQGIADESATSLVASDPLELILRAVTLSVGDTEFALGVLFTVASLLAAGGEVLGFVGLPSLKQLANTAPDDTGHSACTPCPTPCQFFDFTIDDQDWTAGSEGVYVAGSGWGSNPGNNPGRIAIFSPEGGNGIPSGTYSTVTLTTSRGIGGNRGRYFLRRYSTNPLTLIETIETVTAPSATTITFDSGFTLNAGEIIRIDVERSADANDATDMLFQTVEVCS